MQRERVPQTGTRQGAHLGAIRKAIGRAKGLDELLPLLELLFRETTSLLNDRSLDAHEVGRLALPLAKIHSLLAGLARPGSDRDGGEDHAVLIRALAEHFSELDGHLKELRNDLARKERPPAA